VPRPAFELADVLNQHGDAYLRAHAGHLSLGQRKVISAIRACRTAALGGHVARCEACDHVAIAYNSCRNRHCPKCQGQTARAWLEQRQADLLPVPYYHVVFTLPAPVAAVAFQNKAVVYDCLVPGFDGALFSPEWRDALWAKFFMGAPARQRRCVARSNIVKRA
jgi:Transposase zinc-binding domain